MGGNLHPGLIKIIIKKNPTQPLTQALVIISSHWFNLSFAVTVATSSRIGSPTDDFIETCRDKISVCVNTRLTMTVKSPVISVQKKPFILYNTPNTLHIDPSDADD